jgi:hypothetical protein
VERSHLSDLMSNVQKMHNDLERSGENDRRRLENQMQMMDGQVYVGVNFIAHSLNVSFAGTI